MNTGKMRVNDGTVIAKTVKIQNTIRVQVVPSKAMIRLLFTDLADGVRTKIHTAPYKYVVFFHRCMSVVLNV